MEHVAGRRWRKRGDIPRRRRVAGAHLRLIWKMSDPDAQRRYIEGPEVWSEIRAVYDEYLGHCPRDRAERSMYAALCFQAGRYAESHKQFQAVGGDPVGNRNISEASMRRTRDEVARLAKE